MDRWHSKSMKAVQTLLLSVQPRFAHKIMNGDKTVELRRRLPRLETGFFTLMYVSAPIMALVGGFWVERTVSAPIEELWSRVRNKAGMTHSEFDSYFRGKEIGHALFFDDFLKLREQISLDAIRKICPNFHPPQIFRYLRIESNSPDLLLCFACGKTTGLRFD